LLFLVKHSGSPSGISLQAIYHLISIPFCQPTQLNLNSEGIYPCVEQLKIQFKICFSFQEAYKMRMVRLHSANQMRVFLVLGQSGVSNFALVRKKLRKNFLCLNQSAISNFALYVINVFINRETLLTFS